MKLSPQKLTHKPYPDQLIEDVQQLSRDLAAAPKTTETTQEANLELVKRAYNFFTEWFEYQESRS